MIRMKVLRLLLLAVSLVAGGFAGDGTLKGIVTDRQNLAISKTRVLVRHVYGPQEIVVYTDKDGRYEVNVPADQVYDVLVSAVAFAPTCTRFESIAGKSYEYSPRLVYSSVGMNEDSVRAVPVPRKRQQGKK